MSVYAQDTFTGVDGTLLTDHVGEVDCTWTRHPSTPSGATPTLLGGHVVTNPETTNKIFVASGTPTTEGYSVVLRVGRITAGSQKLGAVVRLDPTAATYYAMDVDGTNLRCIKVVSGVTEVLRTEPCQLDVGDEYLVTFQIKLESGTWTALLGFVQRLSDGKWANRDGLYVESQVSIFSFYDTDSPLTGIGQAGLWYTTTGASGTDPVYYIDSFNVDIPLETMAAGDVSLVSKTSTTVELSYTGTTGGVDPYTYQWYRSTSSGFTPGAGTLLSGATSETLSDSSVSPATTYYYVLRTTDSEARTVDSTQFMVTTLSTLTAPVPTFVSSTPTSITFTSSPATGGASPYTYQWYRHTSSALVAPAPEYLLAGATTLELVDSGLNPGWRYYYILEVTDSGSSTAYSTRQTITTPYEDIVPGTISLSSKTGTGVELSCTAASGGDSPYSYQWYRSTSSVFTPGVDTILEGETALTLSDSGLSPGTTYYYIIRVTDSQPETADSTTFSVTTTNSLVSGTISLDSATHEQLNLSCSTAEGGVAPYTYQWYRSTSSGFAPGPANILTGETALSLVDNNVTSGTTYYYVVQVTDSQPETASSVQLSVEVEYTPIVVGEVSLVSKTDTEASLSCTSFSGGLGPYTYEWHRSEVSGFTPSEDTLVQSSFGLTLSDTGLSPATTYYYVVKVTDAQPETANTAELAVATEFPAHGITHPNVFFSPYNWYSDGVDELQGNNIRSDATYALTSCPGAYFKAAFTGTMIKVTVDVSALVNAGADAAEYPKIAYAIDGADTYTTYQLTSGDEQLVLADDLAEGSHTLVFHLVGVSSTLDRWNNPLSVLKITGFELSVDAEFEVPTLFTNRMVIFGDAQTEGQQILGSVTTVDNQDSTLAWPSLIARAMTSEYGIIGYQSQGYTQAGSGNVPDFEASWQHHFAGNSRLVDGALTPAPNYILCAHGTTDADTEATSTAVANTITALRLAAVNAVILPILPPDLNAESAIRQGVLEVDDATTYVIDTSQDWLAGPYDNEGVLSQSGHAYFAAATLAQILSVTISGEGGTGTTPAAVWAYFLSAAGDLAAQKIADFVNGENESSKAISFLGVSDRRPVAGMRVQFFNEDGEYLNRWKATDSLGVTTVNLDDGDYIVKFMAPTGYLSPDNLAITVSEDTTHTIEVVPSVTDASTDATLCRVQFSTINLSGDAVQNVEIIAQLMGGNQITLGGKVVVNNPVTAYTDESGYAAIDLIRSSEIDDGTSTYRILVKHQGKIKFDRVVSVPDLESTLVSLAIV